MRRYVVPVVAGAIGLTSGLSAPASADPPMERTGTVQVTSFTPMPEARRVTGNVVHFEFRLTALLTGDMSATTTEHYKCVLVNEVVKCSGQANSDWLTGAGNTQSHIRLTCDARLIRCDATTHFRGVDNDGEAVRGKGDISTILGRGTYTVRLTHG